MLENTAGSTTCLTPLEFLIKIGVNVDDSFDEHGMIESIDPEELA